MPENRTEWGILGLGLVVLAVLGAVIGLNLGDDPGGSRGKTTLAREARPAEPLAPPAATTTRTTPAPPVTPAKPELQVKAKPKPVRPVKQRGVRLRLSAMRGDSWLEVRSGSSAGTVLFSGTLVRGATRVFRAARLWVRFGGASNLDARLNGRALGLRFGTYDALVTTEGLGPPS